MKLVGINPDEIVKQRLQLEKEKNKKQSEGFFERLRKGRIIPKEKRISSIQVNI